MQKRNIKVYKVYLTDFDLQTLQILKSKWFKSKKWTYSRILRKCLIYYLVSEVVYAKR